MDFWPCHLLFYPYAEIDKAWKILWFSSTSLYSWQIEQADLGSLSWISVGMSGFSLELDKYDYKLER